MNDSHNLNDLAVIHLDGDISPPQRMVVWRIGQSRKGGKFYLENLHQPSNQTGSEFMENLRSKTRTAVSPLRTLFRKPVVYTATISPFSQLDVEACRATEVIVTHKEYNNELTAAFARPELIAHVQDFAVHCTDLLEGSQLQGVTEMKKALLVSWELDRGCVMVLLIMAALLSAGMSLMMGLLTRRADIAIAYAASCFTAVQILQTFILWYFN